METRSVRHSVRSQRRPPKLEGATDRPRPAGLRPASTHAHHAPADVALVGLKHLI